MRFIINIIFLSIFFSCNAKPKETVEPEAKIPEPVTTAVAKKIADKYLTTETIETSFGNLFAIKADNITPHFVDSVAPDPNDKNIVLSIACAFTGERLDTFRTRNICGDYVTNGRFRKGYRGKYNTGYFLAYNGKFFIKKREDIQHAIDLAKKNKGQLFQQYLIINDGKVQGSIFKQDRIYRAVVIKNGELYEIGSASCRERVYVRV